jgi:hypothetical protein
MLLIPLSHGCAPMTVADPYRLRARLYRDVSTALRFDDK